MAWTRRNPNGLEDGMIVRKLSMPSAVFRVSGDPDAGRATFVALSKGQRTVVGGNARNYRPETEDEVAERQIGYRDPTVMDSAEVEQVDDAEPVAPNHSPDCRRETPQGSKAMQATLQPRRRRTSRRTATTRTDIDSSTSQLISAARLRRYRRPPTSTVTLVVGTELSHRDSPVQLRRSLDDRRRFQRAAGAVLDHRDHIFQAPTQRRDVRTRGRLWHRVDRSQQGPGCCGR